jgi:hypothetical protein
MSGKFKEFTPGRGYTKEDWDEVSDPHELTDEELAQAKPFAEVFPELAASIKRARQAESADQGAHQPAHQSGCPGGLAGDGTRL